MSNNSGMNAIVSIVAILAIVVVGWYAVQLLQQEQEDTPLLDVNLESDEGAPAS